MKNIEHKVIYRKRRCLKCEKWFKSFGSGNRMCRHCRGASDTATRSLRVLKDDDHNLLDTLD